MESLTSMKNDKALEVACGEAHCTEKLLIHKFHETDLFDQCPEAIKDANKKLDCYPKLGNVSISRMQDFTFDSKYNCILCRYCPGYLSDDELVEFLQKAAKNLIG